MLVTPVSQKSRSLRTFISLGLSGLSLATLVAFTPASWGTAAAADTAAPPQPVSKGSLPNDVIQRVVRERYPDLQKCYQRLPEPPANTQIEMHFVIGSDGSVTSGHIDSAERPALGKCAEPIMKSMRFPAPTTGEVAVAYPIAFVSDTAEQKGRVTEPGAEILVDDEKVGTSPLAAPVLLDLGKRRIRIACTAVSCPNPSPGPGSAHPWPR